MARETLKSFLSQRGSNSDRITYVQKESPDGLGVDPGTNEELLDLSNSLKGLLGDYLKHIVDNSSSEYKIKGGNELAASNNRGDSLQFAENQGAEKVFVEHGTELYQKLSENSNSMRFNSSGTNLDTLFDKVGKNFSNHEKLKEIQGRNKDITGNILQQPAGENNQIVQATQKLFKANNRFANINDEKQKSFVEDNQDIKDFENFEKTSNSGTVKISNEFGVSDKEKFITNYSNLKKMGASILLKSSGFSSGFNPSNSTDPENINIDSMTSKYVNNLNGYQKVNVNDLGAKNSFGFPTDELGNSVREGKGYVLPNDPEADNTFSFGSTYNTEFQMTNKNLKLHKLEAAISLITLSKISKVFFENFINMIREKDRVDLVKSSENFVSENKGADVGIYMLGASSKLASNKIHNKITKHLLTNTNYPFSDAVDRGLEIILGKSSNPTTSDVLNGKTSVGESPGFWLAVARSVLKSFDSIIKKYSDSNSLNDIPADSLPLVYKDIMETNKFIQFYNVMAVIGDLSLTSTGGLKTKLSSLGKNESNNPRDLNLIKDNKAMPSKYRKHTPENSLYKNKELAWNQDASPSTYLLPANIIKAAYLLNNSVTGQNPLRGMFGSKLIANTYTGIDTFGSYARIPNELVKVLEDKLDAEYMPFYIQDLRTNEIIAFNAFLDSLTDDINMSSTKSSGYGRLDPVLSYEGTTRTVGFSFTLMSTNREDFDSMWYKINKLTTLFYPQWTPGTMVSNQSDSRFYQPFSQVIGASPLVRVRIGDVIKSNYSKFALARTFGIGDEGVNPKIEELSDSDNKIYKAATGIKDQISSRVNQENLVDYVVKGWLTVFGSPISLANNAFDAINWTPKTNIGKIAKNDLKKSAIAGLSNLLVNGYANPLAINSVLRQLIDPNIDNNSLIGKILKTENGFSVSNSDINISNILREMYLKPNFNTGYYCVNGKKYLIPRRLKVRILEKGNFKGLPEGIIGYKVKVIDANTPADLDVNAEDNELIVMHSDILPLPDELFNNTVMGALLFAADPAGAIVDSTLTSFANEYALSKGIPSDVTNFVSKIFKSETNTFMDGALNPYVKAFETTKGRGLAGMLGGIKFDWLKDEFPWEMDYNARAPMGVKISLTLSVIHDIPPGIDHTGFNRAPLYNVGEIMRNISGDVYDDNGAQAEFNFRKEGKAGTRVMGGSNKT